MEAGITFYDEEHLRRRASEQQGLTVDGLPVPQEREVLSRQMERRVRYDRMMRELVREVAEAAPLRQPSR